VRSGRRKAWILNLNLVLKFFVFVAVCRAQAHEVIRVWAVINFARGALMRNTRVNLPEIAHEVAHVNVLVAVGRLRLLDNRLRTLHKPLLLTRRL